MTLSCPACRTRFRIEPRRIQGKRVSLKCPRCQRVFKVDTPAPQPPSGLRVVVCHSDLDLCGSIGRLLDKEGMACTACQDGHQALRSIAELGPNVVLLDVGLQGVFAFEVIDKIRHTPGLEKVKIILLSSIYNKTAYKRRPETLYGADDYLEKHHIPGDLVPKIRELVGIGVEAPAPAPPVAAGEGTAVAEERQELDEALRRTEGGESATELTGEEDKARRLAHIIVSDIVLYHQDRVEEGVRGGTFFELLSEEIEEGRRLFNQRVAPELARQEDFLGNAFSALIERQQRELQLASTV
ncbi:response regulator [uncultured Desulfuromonas sp.]|uniref:response regulator n=1 Tax=uncultured Desulfuromonas sp. TaxID=181013 RepID=UPI002606609D|nr:response regulator [uncultured Desulfuromonas sp.]